MLILVVLYLDHLCCIKPAAAADHNIATTLKDSFLEETFRNICTVFGASFDFVCGVKVPDK